MRIYFDTSFLSSLYAVDANTAAAVEAVQPIGAIRLVSQLTELELRNALQLRVFRKELTPASAQEAQSIWEKNVADGHFQVCPLPEAWLKRSHIISKKTTARLGVRSLDLIHVASALELEADALFSFDERQRKLAREFKLNVN